MPDELRKYIRFQAKDGTFAAFFLPEKGDECFMLGMIIDISEGGLGVCHIDIEGRQPSSMLVSVYGLEGAGTITKIPCRIVYDVEIPDEARAVLSGRRCGIQFEGLSEEQVDELKEFLKKVGIGAIDILE